MANGKKKYDDEDRRLADRQLSDANRTANAVEYYNPGNKVTKEIRDTISSSQAAMEKFRNEYSDIPDERFSEIYGRSTRWRPFRQLLSPNESDQLKRQLDQERDFIGRDKTSDIMKRLGGENLGTLPAIKLNKNNIGAIDPVKLDPEKDVPDVELKKTTLPPVKIDVKSGPKSAMDVAKEAQDNLHQRMADPEEGVRFIDGKPENALPKFSYEEVQLDAKDDPDYEDIQNMKRNALKAIANVRKWKGPLDSPVVTARKK